MSGAVTKFALPGPLRVLGKKHVEQAAQWVPTASFFGATAGFTLLYFTDWKAVLQYFPFYNGKFKEQESSE